ncbi:hypothetical protein JKP88DRAFT_277392 [Tribonema minus]|uniref:Uncharacterized protein n=1 Tax=Tribonema minus TaxID=303371 RepID=A0A836CF97_9STRA|nr:hypothetical protein JKP88DRAFT_277392 [Tribonema minus]
MLQQLTLLMLAVAAAVQAFASRSSSDDSIAIINCSGKVGLPADFILRSAVDWTTLAKAVDCEGGTFKVVADPTAGTAIKIPANSPLFLGPKTSLTITSRAWADSGLDAGIAVGDGDPIGAPDLGQPTFNGQQQTHFFDLDVDSR